MFTQDLIESADIERSRLLLEKHEAETEKRKAEAEIQSFMDEDDKTFNKFNTDLQEVQVSFEAWSDWKWKQMVRVCLSSCVSGGDEESGSSQSGSEERTSWSSEEASAQERRKWFSAAQIQGWPGFYYYNVYIHVLILVAGPV